MNLSTIHSATDHLKLEGQLKGQIRERSGGAMFDRYWPLHVSTTPFSPLPPAPGTGP